jgi:hypothetical protein
MDDRDKRFLCIVGGVLIAAWAATMVGGLVSYIKWRKANNVSSERVESIYGNGG